MGVFAEDETVEKHISSLFGRCKWQAGVIVGSVTEKRHYAVAVIPTPFEDPESPGDFASLDKGWVVLHAEQVRQSLPGGLDIIGVYLFGSGKVDYAAKLRQLAYAVCRGGTDVETSQFGEGTDAVPTRARLAVHVCADTKKLTCRTYEIETPTASARPTEWKYKSFVSKWQTLTCGVDVSATVDLTAPRKGEPLQLETAIQASLQPECARIADAAVIFGEGVQLSRPSAELPETPIVKATLFVPVGLGLATRGVDPIVSVVANVQLAGELTGLAVVPPKSTVAEGARALKADLVRSLQARCLSVCRGWDEDTADEGGDVNGSAAVIQKAVARLPVRVAAPLVGPILLSDYITEGDVEENSDFAETIERFQEVFGLHVDAASIKPLETCAPEKINTADMPILSASTTAHTTAATQSTAQTAKCGDSGGNNTMLLVAATVLLVAVVVGALLSS
eukprot:m.377985 g.377985  ORF g.377985 m.377985 type:complete len:451 (-) comp28211_c1_seq5:76-1428(-)